MYRRPPDKRKVCFEDANSNDLFVSLQTTLSFVLVDASVRISLLFERPCPWKYFLVSAVAFDQGTMSYVFCFSNSVILSSIASQNSWLSIAIMSS